MKKLLTVLAAALAFCAVPAAHAVEVVCGNLAQGIRVTMVDPGLDDGLCLTGTGNLGDTALVGLPQIDAVLDRDSANNNGGLLSIGGTGGFSGTWSFAPSAWQSYSQLFLYFHFGNAEGFGWFANPDWFIVELARNDTAGTWELGPDSVLTKFTGLSNIALLGAGRPTTQVPEPATLALAGLALLAAAAVGRRRRTR